MELPIKVIRKIWTPLQSVPDTLRHQFEEIKFGEKMFNKFLRQAKENKDRFYYVELILIEYDVVRQYKLLNPTKKRNLLSRDDIIKR